MARCQRPLLQGTHRALVAGRVARSADAATPRVCRSRVRPVGLLDIADDEPLEPLDHHIDHGLKRFASPVEPTRGQRYSPVRLIQQVEAGDPVVLPFPGSVSQFATLVEIDGALEGMVRLALVQSDLDSPAQAGVRGPVDHEQGAFDAADFPQGGRQLVLARIGGELAQDLARPHGSRRPGWPPRAGCPPSCRRSGPRSPCRRPAGAGASGRPRGRTHGGVWKAGRGCAGRTRSRGASTRRRHGRGEDQPRQRPLWSHVAMSAIAVAPPVARGPPGCVWRS